VVTQGMQEVFAFKVERKYHAQLLVAAKTKACPQFHYNLSHIFDFTKAVRFFSAVTIVSAHLKFDSKPSLVWPPAEVSAEKARCRQGH
jgi:hypothetical protein